MSNDEIKNKIWDLIAEYDETGQLDECAEEIDSFMKLQENIKSFKIDTDSDVFDSCGLDIFYVSVAWVDENDTLEICGDRLTSC